MRVVQETAPTLEPITLAELKEHLRIDSGSLADNFTGYQNIKPGEKVVANNYTTHIGAKVEVLGLDTLVLFDAGAVNPDGIVASLAIAVAACAEGDGTYNLIFAGACTTPATGTYDIATGVITAVTLTGAGAGYAAAPTVATQSGNGSVTATIDGSVDAKILESDDDATWTDWTGGAFTQVTRANDEALNEKQYTGGKRYIKTAAKVLGTPAVFSTTIITNTATSDEDDYLTSMIKGSRGEVEAFLRMALLTQTWDYSLPAWPAKNYIELPFGNLASVTSVKWKDTDGTETTLAAGTDYLVETNGWQLGRIVLPYGGSWPGSTLYPSNPITIRFVCGWASQAAIPEEIKNAVKMLCAKRYLSRGEDIIGTIVAEQNASYNLIRSYRLWGNF